MRKIIESVLVSLDGVIDDPAKWAGPYIDAAFQAAALERLSHSDIMLMGTKTYELLARDWATQTGDFADAVNGIRKYVFSSTLERAEWRNSTIVRADVVDTVRKLKEEGGREISVWGHGMLGQTLLRHGLLDEIRLSIFPVIVGGGRLLFREGESARLRLIATEALTTGVVVMRYQPQH